MATESSQSPDHPEVQDGSFNMPDVVSELDHNLVIAETPQSPTTTLANEDTLTTPDHPVQDGSTNAREVVNAPDRNPTVAEIEGDPVFKESGFDSFPCALLDNNDQQLGDWCDGDEVVKLQFRSCPDFSEPRIDIRLTIKWNEQGVPSAECPANATFRIFNNQIESIEPLLVVSHALALRQTSGAGMLL
ncbi:hypothetical protein N7465_006102 [Penicillium sp. CMV-2018d]|nr:hypothetical protein N7465_006102 [Penicillium sp. CMV-2018d]